MKLIHSLWLRLYAHYRDYHAYGPPRLKYMGYVGAVSLIAFWFVRFTRPNPHLFDDIGMRGTAFLTLLALALKDHWPEKLKRHYLAYSYVAVLYTLPCFTVLVALQRGGGLPAISNTFITLCFLVLLTDWRNTLVMVAAGTALAAGFYVLTTAQPKVPMDLVAQLPAFTLIIIGGNLFKFSTEQIDAERKLRATQALAGSIAHEMRNPLSRIRHALERMQASLPSPTTTGQAQALAPTQADALYRHLAESEVAVKRGLQVIAMTLDEVSAKPIDSSAFSYLSAADATRKALQEYAFESDEEASRVSIEVADDFTFRGDETAYLFVIFNLLKNALYYLPAHEHATINLSISAQRVTVHDNGPGMAPDVLARLFQPFATVGKSGGTGLGLAYCRRVMQAFGGDISCESVLGEYTRFTLRFPAVPLTESQTHQRLAMERARAAFVGKRILLVDDDAAQRLTTRHKLLALGADIDQCGDGQRALDALSRQRYDLVLLDLNMPVLDGYAVAESVRRGVAPLNIDVAIVAYTSEPAHLAMVKTRKAGMDGFVGKPCAQPQLIHSLHEALQLANARHAPRGLDGCRVLLADDSPQNRRSVAAYLRHAGAAVTEADHGGAVLQLLRGGGAWDAILMDINMPGMDGLEAARAIRKLPGAIAGIPIIALTAHADDATVQAAQDAGMNDFMTKPVEAAALYRKLGELVTGPRPAPVPLQPTISPVAAGPSDRLLNVERLESYRRIGMLDELLDDYLPEIAGLSGKLQRHVAQQDFESCLDTLHSLLGMSGEAGAQALYQAVRRVYIPMVETRAWPAQGGWAGNIAALAAETDRALKAYGPSHAAQDAG